MRAGCFAEGRRWPSRPFLAGRVAPMARLGDHGDGSTEGNLVDAIQSIGAFDSMRLRKGPVGDRPLLTAVARLRAGTDPRAARASSRRMVPGSGPCRPAVLLMIPSHVCEREPERGRGEERQHSHAQQDNTLPLSHWSLFLPLFMSVSLSLCLSVSLSSFPPVSYANTPTLSWNAADELSLAS